MTSPAKHPNQALIALLAMSFIWGYSWVVVKEAFRFIDPLDFVALRTFTGAPIQFEECFFFSQPFWIAPILSALGMIAALQIVEYRRRSAGRSEFGRPFF